VLREEDIMENSFPIFSQKNLSLIYVWRGLEAKVARGYSLVSREEFMTIEDLDLFILIATATIQSEISKIDNRQIAQYIRTLSLWQQARL